MLTRSQKAVAAAAQAVAEADAAIVEAKEANREVEAAETDVEARHAFAETALKILQVRSIPRMVCSSLVASTASSFSHIFVFPCAWGYAA